MIGLRVRDRLLPVLWLLLLCFTRQHEIVNIESPSQSVQGIINHELSIQLPEQIDKVFAVKTKREEDARYLSVLPASVQMKEISQVIVVPRHVETVLESLRSYHSIHYRAMLAFDGFVILHEAPDTIVSYRQTLTQQMRLQAHYSLPDVSSRDLTNLYPYGPITNSFSDEMAGLLVINNKKFMYKVEIKEYIRLECQQPVSIAHLQFVAEDIFIAAEFSHGLSIYRVFEQNNKLQKLFAASCESLSTGNPQCYITDLSYNQSSSLLFVLDERSGVHSYKLSNNTEHYSLSEHSLLFNVMKCESMDMLSISHFVLICQLETPTYILEVTEMTDPLTKQSVYVKRQPMYHSCDFQDLLVTHDFYLMYNAFEIDVFWNSLANGLLESQHTKSHLNVEQLEVFTIRQDKSSKLTYIYALKQNVLIKYKLVLNKGGVYLHSSQPLNKAITLQLEGPCQQPPHPTTNNQYPLITCIYSKQVHLTITQSMSNRHEVSISLVIIILMLAILLILVSICVIKYKFMQKFMREVLRKHRAASRRAERISI